MQGLFLYTCIKTGYKNLGSVQLADSSNKFALQTSAVDVYF